MIAWPADSGFRTIVMTEFERSSIASDLKGDVIQWARGAQDEITAQALVPRLNNVFYPDSQTRYRFPQQESSRSLLLKAIFETSFKQSPEIVCSAAENAGKTSGYPLWKRVCWIQIPQMAEALLGNQVITFIISFSTCFFLSMMAYQAYAATTFFFTTQFVPLAINHTPLAIVRLFNQVFPLHGWIFQNPLKTVCFLGVTCSAIRGLPEIPYISAVARTFNAASILLDLCFPPILVVWNMNVETDSFITSSLSYAERFCRDIALKSRAEELMISKEPALQFWMDANQMGNG